MNATRHQEVRAFRQGRIRRESRRPFLSLLPILVWVLAGCATLTRDVYKGYPGQDKPDAELAIVRAESAQLVGVDGMPVKHPDSKNSYYYEARLLPGSHSVTLYKWFAVSVRIVPKGYLEVVRSFTMDMKPGHVYELHADRTVGFVRVYVWIKDTTTGEIVAGEKR
jgi:hypothetical protein